MTHLQGTELLLGNGLISWPSSERVTNRYGLINLYRAARTGESYDLKPKSWQSRALGMAKAEKYHGQLVAVFGDEELVLGEGTLFMEYVGGLAHIGLRPDDGRKEEWLNPENLHEIDGNRLGQVILLYFVPSK